MVRGCSALVMLKGCQHFHSRPQLGFNMTCEGQTGLSQAAACQNNIVMG